MLHNCLLFLSLAISVDMKKIILRNEYIPLLIKIQCKSIQDAIQHGQKKRMRHYYNIIKSFNIWNEFLTRTYLMVPFYVVEALLGSLYIKKIQK